MSLTKTTPHHAWLLLILTLYLALGLVTSMIVPLGESPDEEDHFLYVQYLAQERTFPVMDPVFANNETMEANQPPLYYLLGALLTGWVGMDAPGDLPLNACFSYNPDAPGRQTFYRHAPAEQFPWQGTVLAFHLVRGLSLLLGAGTVLLAYALGRQVTPEDPRLGLAAAAILAFNPQFVFISASANNDNLAALLGAAVVLAAVKIAQTASRLPPGNVSTKLRPDLLILSLLVGLGALTKFSLLGLWPLAFLAVLLPAWRQRRIPWSELILLTLVPLLIAGWWYWRAHGLYGDPLAWEVHLAAKGAYVLRLEPLRPADLLDFVLVHFQSYWGWFGWLNIKLPLWVYWTLAGVVVAAILGLLKATRDGLSKPDRYQLPVASLFPALAVLIIYASLLRYIQTINWSGYQGRLAYTAAAPIAVLLAAGLRSIGGGRLSQAVGAALFPLAVASLIGVITPAYPRPQIYQPSPHTVTFAPECARFEAGLELEAYIIDETANPGASLPVTLYAYGLASSTQPQTIAVQIAGRDGNIAGRAQTELAWDAGQVVSVTLLVPINANALPSRAVLQVGLLMPEGEWQPAASPIGRSLDLPVPLAALKIAPAVPIGAQPQHEVGADFGHQLALLGYDLVESEMAISLTLYWQTTATMIQDYTVFVHLLDRQGQLIVQHDGQPQEGWYPTTIWEAGEVVVDRVTLVLPPGAPPGPYQLAVGVYPLETLERLPVVINGVAQPDDQIIIRNLQP